MIFLRRFTPILRLRSRSIEDTRIITSELPNVYIIGLSMHPDDQRGVEIREAGAMEYLTKDAPLHNLVDTIRKRQ